MSIGDAVWFWSTRAPRITAVRVEGVIVSISADGHHALIAQFGRFDSRRLVSVSRLTKIEEAA